MIRSFSAPQLAHWKSACGSISPGLVSRHFVISVNAMQPTLIKGRCACTGSIDWTCQATIATNSSCRMLYIGRIVASADASEKKSLSCMEKWENGPRCVRTVKKAKSSKNPGPLLAGPDRGWSQVLDAFSPTGLDLMSPSRPRREGKGSGVRKAQPHPVPSAGWLSAGTQGADQR